MDIQRAKEEIKQTVRAYLACDDTGAPLIPPVRQRPILLMGPPGVGKTQIMEQIAQECGIALVAYTMVLFIVIMIRWRLKHGYQEEQLRREQKLLLDYARMAVTEENVDILARQALAARPSVSASTLADEYPNDFARIIGLHTYSQSPRRCYDIQLTGEWATRGGFRFEEFTLTPRKEDAEDDRNE